MVEAVFSTQEILSSFGFENKEIVLICKKQFERFFVEHGSPKTLKSEIEQLYRNIHCDIDERSRARKKNKDEERLRVSISELLEAHKSKKVKSVTLEKLAIDVIHMHLNRLFVYDQRYYEMVTYFLLQRMLTVQNYKSR